MDLTVKATAAAAVLAVTTTLVAAPAVASPMPTTVPSPTVGVTARPTPAVTPTVTPSPVAPTPAATAPSSAPTISVPVAMPATTPAPAVPIPVPTSQTPAPTPTPTPVPVVPAPVAAAISVTSGRTSLSRTVTMTGTHLTNLSAVLVGGVPATNLVVTDDGHAAFVIPNAVNWQAGARPISLRSASDWTVRPTSLTFTYLVTTRVERQMAYAFQNWNRTYSVRFGYLSANDCANFASQTLLARGWKPSSQWFNKGQGDWSATWVSSTAMSDWLKHRPDLATRLLYRQRDQVVVGDIVQFHWGWSKKAYSGWDHTAIVSKVVVLPNGRHDIYYVAHTNNSQYGGSTQYFAQHFTKRLRIQFFHLLK